MKKIISLGIASAVLALTAISASAAVVVKTDDKIETGKTITVSFVTDVDLPANSAPGFKVVATGVEYVAGSEKATDGIGVYSNDTGKFGFIKTNAAKAGDVLATITYTVTAKAGEAVTINVVDPENFGDTNVTPLQVTVEENKPDDSSSETPSSSDSGTSSETPSGSDSGSTPVDPNKPADTGIALAVFPAIIAGAAVVVAKKRK